MATPQQETKLVVRLDRSRDFSTIHGERLQNDPHYAVHFYQYGLPFDSHGELLADHPEIAADPRKQATVEKLLKKATKVKKDAPGDAVKDLLGEDENEDSDDTPELNLEMWARGEQQWPWQQVTDAIAARFAKRVTDKKGAIEVLIEERIVSLGQLAPQFRKLVS